MKEIVIAVTGSIAAYKTCELVRNLKKKNLPVRVIMTENATRFVGTLTFQVLTGQPVFTTEWQDGMLHIDLKNLASVFAVVPATANTIAKMASGIADDLVSSTYLAMNCPVIVAPAMNPNMYCHPATIANLETLKSHHVTIISPDQGEVICGDVGQGKLAEISIIEKIILEHYESR